MYLASFLSCLATYLSLACTLSDLEFRTPGAREESVREDWARLAYDLRGGGGRGTAICKASGKYPTTSDCVFLK